MALRTVGTRSFGAEEDDSLRMSEVVPGYNAFFYEPSAKKLETATHFQKQPIVDPPRKLIESGYLHGRNFVIYPLNTFPTHRDFLKPKYEQIESIFLDGWGRDTPESVEDVMVQLESLPSGFAKDPSFGLGLLHDYRSIIDAIEKIPGVLQLVLSDTQPEGLNDDFFVLRYDRFDELRRGINRIAEQHRGEARKDKAIFAHNELLARFLPVQFPEAQRPYKADTIFKLIGSTTAKHPLSRADQSAAVRAVGASKRKLAEDSPAELCKLHNEIELVSLEVLIEKFEGMMDRNHNERRWQELFNANPFILNLAFGYPVFKVRDQAHLGGQTLHGSGASITDFLVKHSISNNIALFEIKTPQSELTAKTEYRNGLYGPSTDLAGAMSQLLDQKYELQRGIATLKENTRIYDIETFSVQGVLVIGRMPNALNKGKSFELFRGNSKDISIFTFDELLLKLKNLLALLRAESTD